MCLLSRTSYVSPAMLELEKGTAHVKWLSNETQWLTECTEAKEAGITVMNEIGLDPGIDHLYVRQWMVQSLSIQRLHD